MPVFRADIPEGNYLSMWTAEKAMIPFTQDALVVHKDSPYSRIGGDMAYALPRQVKTPGHPGRVMNCFLFGHCCKDQELQRYNGYIHFRAFLIFIPGLRGAGFLSFIDNYFYFSRSMTGDRPACK